MFENDETSRAPVEHSTRPVNTRLLELHESPRAALDRVYVRVRAYLSQLAGLHATQDLEQALTLACRALGELFDVASWRICRYDATEGSFRTLKESPALKQSAQEFNDLVEYAARSRQVLFFDIRETPTDKLGYDGGKRPTVNLSRHTSHVTLELEARTICMVPVSGRNGPLAVILLWIRDSDAASKLLEAELVQSLSQELGAQAESIAMNARLRQLGSLFDNILESVPQGIVAVSREGRVIALNANAEFLFNLKRIFVLDESFEDALPKAISGEFRRMMDSLLLKPGNVETQLKVELNQGTQVNLGISASYLLDRQGQPLGYLFLCRDLSLSLEVQKLRELDQLKTEFVNTVSHELKTPLTAILGGLEILASDLAAVPPDQRELLGVINDSALRLRDLIFDLLNLSRLESGRVQLKEAPCELRPLIEGVVRLLPAHPRHLIEIDVQPGLEAVLLDGDKIRQALTNYSSNAIKYSPKGGRVIIRAIAEGEELVLSVSDEGLGISPDNISRLFQKFYRVNASYTAEIEGTGLGLVIVKRIAELHGGRVFVESELGRGSTFGLRLPLRTVSRDAESA